MSQSIKPKGGASPLRRAIWRGTSIIAPPLVTLLLLIWIISAVESYVLWPLESAGRSLLVWAFQDVLESPPPGAELTDPNNPSLGFKYQGKNYVHPPSKRKFIPEYVLLYVDNNVDNLPRDMQNPLTSKAYHHAYVKLRYMPRWFTFPLLLLVLLSVLFFVGRFLAAGVGRIFVNGFERAINSLPFVRNLYSSVKQVTDFVLSERDMEFTRVVAVEYPRKGLWSLGFVTCDSVQSLENALNQEISAVYIPASPLPMTGFTITYPKRELIELDMTIDQAIQFIVSCGVVCPAGNGITLQVGSPMRIDPPDLNS
jgi:uncharacterized membrane protein